MPDTSQFNTARSYPGWWTITFINPPINMFVPTTIVRPPSAQSFRSPKSNESLSPFPFVGDGSLMKELMRDLDL